MAAKNLICEWAVANERVCSKPATHKLVVAGCIYCGGGECGDSGDIEYYCDEHSQVAFVGDRDEMVVLND